MSGPIETVHATDDEGGTVTYQARVQLRALLRVECNCYVCARDGSHLIEIISTGGTMFVRNVETETSFSQRTQSGPFRAHLEDSKVEDRGF